jgi:hypothetical protein
MPTKSKNPPPSVHTLNALLEEGEDYMLDLIRVWHKMRQAKPGSERYFNLMADAETCAMVVKSRMESVLKEADAITDAMPDDE